MSAPHTPSILLIGDELYFVSDRGIATCLDAKTGKQHWRERLGGAFSASPFVADGKIYFQDHTGQVFVVAADPEKFTLLHQVHFGDRTVRDQRCSLALANNRVFLRSQKTLYCFGK